MAAATPDPTTSRLHALLELGQKVGASVPPDELHASAADTIASVLGVPSVAIHRWRETADDHVLAAAHGEPIDDHVRIEIAAPLGGTLGYATAGPAADVDPELAETLGGYLSLALATYDERRMGIRRGKALERLLDISSSARETLEPEPLLDEVCAVVESTLGFAAVEIAMIDDGKLVTASGTGRRLDGMTVDEAL